MERMPRRSLIRTSCLMLAVAASPLAAQAWPQYHGPHHDRTARGSIELRDWAANGPPVRWKVSVKHGFSSFSVAGGRAFTLVERDGREACIALDADSGKEVWAAALGESKYDRGGVSGAPDNNGGDGPRSTPSCEGEFVYVFDAQLVLHCLRSSDGAHVWRKDLIADFGGRNIRWQNAASPLVVGGVVYVAGGGPGESLLAFDKTTGEVVWKDHDERITHATPIRAEIHGVEQIIFYVQKGLLSVAPDTGKLLWRIAYPYRVSSAASPVVDGDVVYCSAGYGVGAGAFRIKKTDDGFETELLWRRRNKLMNHWSTPVVKDGHLYGMFGFKKYGKGPLKCVDVRTGETAWSVDGFGPGNCILVGEDLVALSDKGEIVLIEARSDRYTELARADVLRGKCWSTPAFAAGQLYVRSTVEAARLDLSKKSGD